MVDMPSDIDMKYCAIGAIVVQWAFVEELVNDCVLFFYHQYNGKSLKTAKKGIPRTQLGRKLNFLSDCLKNLNHLYRHKEKGLALIDRTKNLSNHRDNIIHSVVAALAPDSILFVKHKYDKNSNEPNKPTLHKSEYNITDLLEIGNKIADLADDWLPYVREFAKDQPLGVYYLQ